MSQNKLRIKHLALLITYLFVIINGNAQSKKSSGLSIYFHVNKADIDPSYMNNRVTLSKIVSVFTTDNLPYINSVRIEAFASPEGAIAFNEKLSWGRAQSIKQYILKHRPSATKLNISAEGIGENWKGLRKLIEDDTKAPRRTEMLSIIDCGLADKKINNGSYYKKMLLDLGPSTWKYIKDNYLPRLRMEALIVVFVEPDAPQNVLTRIKESLRGVKGIIVEITHPEQSIIAKTINRHRIGTAMELRIDTIHLIQPVVTRSSDKWIKKPLLAIKSNLLYDAASILNIEIECPIGKYWSIAGEWIFPWWTIDNGKANSSRHRLQLLSANVDLKYWLGNRIRHQKLDGWFIGAYGGSGKYDFEYTKKGVQGEFCIFAGISGGYAHRISKNIYMEYSLGLGYLRTNYRNYTTKWGYDNRWHPIFEKGGKYTWMGPTKAKISFGWVINYKHKYKGGVK